MSSLPWPAPLIGRSAIALGLLLAAGCSISEPASPTTTTTTTSRGPVPIVLAAEGLLPHEVGTPLALVVTAISDLVGGPDREIPWSPADDSVFGTCPGVEVRGFGWGSLYVIEQRTAAGDTFFTWTYGFDHELAESGDPRGLGLETADGIGLGTTRSELEAVLGDRLEVAEDAAAGIVAFSIDADRPEHVAGRLSARDGAVVYLERVPGCE